MQIWSNTSFTCLSWLPSYRGLDSFDRKSLYKQNPSCIFLPDKLTFYNAFITSSFSSKSCADSILYQCAILSDFVTQQHLMGAPGILLLPASQTLPLPLLLLLGPVPYVSRDPFPYLSCLTYLSPHLQVLFIILFKIILFCNTFRL